ncbi:hypothetical protein RIF29_22283 [Crotalaria pallida]|uniref:Uncharacterized protein n=1 Tax=Crotalaria pallida TaxID=3830 RepID=A0AAN9F423_CROPI
MDSSSFSLQIHHCFNLLNFLSGENPNNTKNCQRVSRQNKVRRGEEDQQQQQQTCPCERAKTEEEDLVTLFVCCRS